MLLQNLPAGSSLVSRVVWGFGVFIGILLVALYRWMYSIDRAQRASQNRSDDPGDYGSVYVLQNPVYPGLVKIGKTHRDPRKRAEELSAHTGVPGPFRVEYDLKVSVPEVVEKKVHTELSEHLVNPNREFFDVSVRKARRVIERIAGCSARFVERGFVRRALGLGGSVLGSLTYLTLLAYYPKNVPGFSFGKVLSVGAPTEVGSYAGSIAVFLIEGTLGYGVLIPVGLLALWGWALFRSRPLRPLWEPTGIGIAIALMVSYLSGWAGFAYGETAIGWASSGAFRQELVPWTGALGIQLAEWGVNLLGMSGGLLPLGLLGAFCGVLAAYWWRRGGLEVT